MVATHPWWGLCLTLLAWHISSGQPTFAGPCQPRRSIGRTTGRVRERQTSPRPRSEHRRSGAVEAGHTDPGIIIQRVTKASLASEILDVMLAERENPEMNLICIGAAWTRLAKHQRSMNSACKSQSVQSFVTMTQSLLENKSSGYARQVANIFWAVAKLQSRIPQLEGLQTALAGAIKSTAKAMNPQEVTNVIWAVATLSAAGANVEAWLAVMPFLATRVRTVILDTNAQDIANSIWSVAQLSSNKASCSELLDLLPLLANRVPFVISEMTEQAAANVIWATRKLSFDSSSSVMPKRLLEVFPAVVSRAHVVLPRALPQHLANYCLGLALVDYNEAGFLEAIAARVVNEASAWNPSGAQMNLPPVVVAFARLQTECDKELLKVVAKKLSPTLGRITGWGLGALAWSYSQLDADSSFLLFRQSLAAEAKRRGFSEQDVEDSRLRPDAWRKEFQAHNRK